MKKAVNQAAEPSKKELWLNIILTSILIIGASKLWPWLTGGITGQTAQGISAMALYAVWIGIVLAIVACKEDRPLSSIGFLRGGLLRELLLGLGLFCVVSMALTILPMLLGVEGWRLLSSFPKDLGVVLPYFIYQLFFVAPAEEIFYRGYLFSRLREAIGSDWAAVAVSAVIFGISHYPATRDWSIVAITGGMGLILAAARLKCRGCGILSISLAHGLYNISLCLLGWILL